MQKDRSDIHVFERLKCNRTIIFHRTNFLSSIYDLDFLDQVLHESKAV